MKALVPALAVALLLAGQQVLADSTVARCDVYAPGQDHGEAMRCGFSQRQGYITISRDDGVVHELIPHGDQPGTFRDATGRAVYRQSGLGDQGQIFRMPDETVYVYWSTDGLEQDPADNPTAPFSTNEYDATTLLRCRAGGAETFEYCPAGILRMEDGQASIVVVGPLGDQFTINFMSNYVNATNREVEAKLQGDTWIVTIEKTEVYEVPLAALEGG